MYSDADAAALYDLLNPWGSSDGFYLSFVMASPSVLDVGCGTGTLLHRARADGHSGRLCGLDPDVAALDRAGRRTDIEWVAGIAAQMRWDREFDLAVMASNAFQVFVIEEDLRASLAAIRAALVDGGRFVFGTRNPLARAWEGWNPANATEVVDRVGRRLRVSHEVESVVRGVVTLTETIVAESGEVLRVDRASLRFLNTEDLCEYAAEAGFGVEEQFGDWSRSPLTPDSENIISVWRRD